MIWRNNIIRALVISMLLAVSLVGCAKVDTQQQAAAANYNDQQNDQQSDDHLTALVGYVNIQQLPEGSNTVSAIRKKAIQETATQLGATGALAWRSVHINAAIEKQASYLDRIFNFSQLMLPHNVLPPVLVEADNELNTDGSDTLRLAAKIYKIEAPAQFVTTAPNWRDYLLMDYQKPTLPDNSLLPTTQAEARLWNYYLKEGWKQGLTQANQIFAVNLNRLKRDYAGMILYRKLYAENMVSAPFVAQADLGVTGNAHELRIDDRVLRITANSALQTDSKKWTPILTK